MLSVRNIVKNTGSFRLGDISLDVADGGYFALMGGSGAGKSMLLGIIAGMIRPGSGNVFLDGQDITQLSIHRRNIGMLFQDFALFPHMNVSSNIAFSLKYRNISEDIGKQRMHELTEFLGIGHLLNRRISGLSGGEKQRVALARVLMFRPRVLLLDEPMASLDIRLRDETVRMLKNLNSMGQTIVHVTHHFGEAMALADTVALLYNGKIIQSGSPANVYESPVSSCVATFTGHKNYMKVSVMPVYDGYSVCRTENGQIIYIPPVDSATTGHVLIPPKVIRIYNQSASEKNSFRGKVLMALPTCSGSEVRIGSGEVFTAETPTPASEFKTGDEVFFGFSPEDARFIPYSFPQDDQA